MTAHPAEAAFPMMSLTPEMSDRSDEDEIDEQDELNKLIDESRSESLPTKSKKVVWPNSLVV